MNCPICNKSVRGNDELLRHRVEHVRESRQSMSDADTHARDVAFQALVDLTDARS